LLACTTAWGWNAFLVQLDGNGAGTFATIVICEDALDEG
jgi:hypothetical protein